MFSSKQTLAVANSALEMSLYHEAAQALAAPDQGGSFKSRVFKSKLKSPPAQVYALALETRKWSEVLTEVVERSGLLILERKVGKPHDWQVLFFL